MVFPSPATPPQWLQASSYSAAQDRRLLGALWPQSTCQGMAVTPGSPGLAVSISAGQAAVVTPNNTGSTLCTSDSPVTVTLVPAPQSGSNRYDLIIVRPRGTDLDGGTNNDFVFDQVNGAIASSPVVPALPAGCMALAQVYVAGGTAAVTTAMIQDLRAQGGMSAGGGGPSLPPVSPSTPFQSVVDSSGEVWVAKGGVNAGMWAKARDVLKARWYRNAAFNLPTTAGILVWDTVDPLAGDPYGLNSGGSLVAPVAGLYRIWGQVFWTTQATMQYGSVQLYKTSTLAGAIGQLFGPAQAGLGGRTQFDSGVVRLAAGDNLQTYLSGSTALTGGTGNNTFISMEYIGSGISPAPGGPRMGSALTLPPQLGPTDPFQSVTDASGEVWVAKGGVRGGNWYRARDVLRCRYYRTAAASFPNTAWMTLGMDTRDYDDYGLYNINSGVGTLPLAGLWRLTIQLMFVRTAGDQFQQAGIWDGVPTNILVSAGSIPAIYSSGVLASSVRKLPAGQQVTTRGLSAPALNLAMPGGGSIGSSNYVELSWESPG